MKKLALGMIAIAAAALLAWAGRAAIMSPPEAIHSQTARATLNDLGTVVKATGVVRPAIDAEVRVGVQSPGVLRRLHVRVGERVAKGQLLAELEARSLRAKTNQALAALQSAQANLRFEITELARKRELVAQQVVAPRELDLAERSFAIADAAVAEARANLAGMRAQLDETRILAPISGVVSTIVTREGETVAAGLAAPTFLTLIDLQRLETWAYVDETDIGRIRVGQKAHFAVDSYPDQPLDAEVVAIYPKPEIRDNVVDYIVVLGFSAQSDVTLRPEMTASVRIALEHKGPVLTVPRRSLHSEQGRSYVLLPNGIAPTRRYVKTANRDDNNIEIIEGLSNGDEVLVGQATTDTTAKE